MQDLTPRIFPYTATHAMRRVWSLLAFKGAQRFALHTLAYLAQEASPAFNSYLISSELVQTGCTPEITGYSQTSSIRFL